MKPEILSPTADKDKIEKLKKDKNTKIVDFLDKQIEELIKVENKAVEKAESVWIYYPWSRTLTHILNKEDFRLVRLSRNKNLITNQEQEKFSRQIIGIAGLTVGNPAALCIILEGGAEKMKFADNDVLELSNLNRFRASLGDLGTNKAVLSAQQAYEIDPFIDIEIFDKGISEENIDKFLLEPKIDLLIEEMDNLTLKIKIRKKARDYKIPVLMVTGNGPGLIVDIERFDLEPNLPLLNGYLKENVIERISKVSSTTPFQEKINMARDFIGKEFLTDRLNQSFDLVGKRLASIPQISESSFLRGAVLCYFAREIALGGKVSSGRYFLNFDTMLSKLNL
jgi:hypothetical protein